jgi:hypothetical protein
MLEPSELLAVARLLSTASNPAELTDARLRRAVSSAYYAVFHTILRAAARRFMGGDGESAAGYGILYRSFDHRHMATVCDALQAPTLKDRYRRNLRKPSVGKDTRDFATIFPSLQAARHQADYDPMAAFAASDVASLIEIAEIAIAAFNRVAADEQADVLALLMVRIRD